MVGNTKLLGMSGREGLFNLFLVYFFLLNAETIILQVAVLEDDLGKATFNPNTLL